MTEVLRAAVWVVFSTVGLVALLSLGFWLAGRMPSVHAALRRTGWAEGALWAPATVTLPVEPINTWTNLAYHVVGWSVAVYAGLDAPAILFGATGTILCICSAIYHGIPTDATQRLDHAGMYGAVGAGLAVYSVAPDTADIAGPMIIAGVLGYARAPVVFAGRLNEMMGIALGLALCAAVYRGDPWLALGSLVVFAPSAYVSLKLDRQLAAHYDPEATEGNDARRIRWLHGAWHIGTAVAIGLMFAAQGG